MKQHRLKVRLGGDVREGVYLDGRRLNSTRVKFDNTAGQPSLVEITIHADVDVTAVVEEDHLSITNVGGLDGDAGE